MKKRGKNMNRTSLNEHDADKLLVIWFGREILPPAQTKAEP